MNKAKKISKEYADRNTCYANDSDLQYRATRKAVEYGYNQAKKDNLNGWINCTEYELPEDKHKDGDEVELIIRKKQKGE